MSDDNIAIRLKFLIEKMGINSSQFADMCKIPRPTFSQILNGRNKKISNQIITQIHRTFPNVSINWLLFNEGTAFIGNPEIDEHSSTVGQGYPHNDHDEKEAKASSEDLQLSEKRSCPEFVDENNSQNQIIPEAGTAFEKKHKETGLISSKVSHIPTDFKDVNSLLENAELIDELNKMRKKQRKVVSVTIYYDDSTFETFKPV